MKWQISYGRMRSYKGVVMQQLLVRQADARDLVRVLEALASLLILTRYTFGIRLANLCRKCVHELHRDMHDFQNPPEEEFDDVEEASEAS